MLLLLDHCAYESIVCRACGFFWFPLYINIDGSEKGVRLDSSSYEPSAIQSSLGRLSVREFSNNSIGQSNIKVIQPTLTAAKLQEHEVGFQYLL